MFKSVIAGSDLKKGDMVSLVRQPDLAVPLFSVNEILNQPKVLAIVNADAKQGEMVNVDVTPTQSPFEVFFTGL